jgi:hypothetical protein
MQGACQWRANSRNQNFQYVIRALPDQVQAFSADEEKIASWVSAILPQHFRAVYYFSPSAPGAVSKSRIQMVNGKTDVGEMER